MVLSLKFLYIFTHLYLVNSLFKSFYFPSLRIRLRHTACSRHESWSTATWGPTQMLCDTYTGFLAALCAESLQSCPTTTPWTVAHQAPLYVGFSRQEYWSGLPFPSPGDLPNPGIEPRSPVLQADPLPTELQGMLVSIDWFIYAIKWEKTYFIFFLKIPPFSWIWEFEILSTF